MHNWDNSLRKSYTPKVWSHSGNRCGPYAVCEASVPLAGWRGVMRVVQGGTHPDEREGAARVDGDAPGVIELGASAGAVEEAKGAAAGERGGRPGGDVDTADPVVATVLRCIMEGHTE